MSIISQTSELSVYHKQPLAIAGRIYESVSDYIKTQMGFLTGDYKTLYRRKYKDSMKLFGVWKEGHRYDYFMSSIRHEIIHSAIDAMCENVEYRQLLMHTGETKLIMSVKEDLADLGDSIANYMMHKRASLC